MSDRYALYRDLFASVDINDHNSLKQWFSSNQHLSIYDHAQIMGKCTKIVSKLRQSVGLGKRGPTKPARVSARTIGPAVIPTNWKDKDWLEDSLRKYSASALIRAIGISRFAFYRHLNKIGYKLAKGNYSKNPCCTKAWCHRHYVELRYTLEECAALAHISRPKFADWLVKFKIPIRSVDDIEAGLLPVVVHKAICQLRPIKSVQSIVALNDYLRVKIGRAHV